MKNVWALSLSLLLSTTSSVWAWNHEQKPLQLEVSGDCRITWTLDSGTDNEYVQTYTLSQLDEAITKRYANLTTLNRLELTKLLEAERDKSLNSGNAATRTLDSLYTSVVSRLPGFGLSAGCGVMGVTLKPNLTAVDYFHFSQHMTDEELKAAWGNAVDSRKHQVQQAREDLEFVDYMRSVRAQIEELGEGRCKELRQSSTLVGYLRSEIVFTYRTLFE